MAIAAASQRVKGVLLGPLQHFFRLESASGILLLGAAVASLGWANSSFGSYQFVFDFPLAAGGYSTTPREAINDALMTLFFFVVGMEIKRELVAGELRTFGRAALPAVAAMGGMLVPALVYIAFNREAPAHHGWGIPVATDIAFCIGVLTLLRSRASQGLLVFLTALAIFDDIGGIVVIAAFYGHGVRVEWLLAAAGVAAALFAGARFGVVRALFYLCGGVLLWTAVHHSGLHATLSGVVLGMAIPTVALDRFIHRMHPSVAFGVMPLFALANSGVRLGEVGMEDLRAGVTLGVALGLVAGKAVGVFVFSFLAVRLGLAPMPGNATPAKLLGVSVIAGIGFTVALFIASLAFATQPRLLIEAKLGILIGSLVAGVAGAGILRLTAVVTDPAPR